MINECAIMVIKTPDSRVVGDPTFYLAGQLIPKSKCYTYLGIPFIQKLINLGLYWIGGFSKRNSFVSLYNISKDLNISPMSDKCALVQCRCYTKWENSKCIIGKLIEFKVNKGKHP